MILYRLAKPLKYNFSCFLSPLPLPLDSVTDEKDENEAEEDEF